MPDGAGMRRWRGGTGAVAPLHGDGGFTLVETVVALALFSVVLAATGLAIVRALTGTGTTDRAVAAVMVANQALENARNVTATTRADGVSALVAGRTRALVDAVDVTDVPLADTDLAYGPWTAAAPLVPLSTTTTVDGTPYTVRVVIGTCRRDRAGGACDLATHTLPVTLYRVTAAVTWPDCASRHCPVTVTTLVDPAPDPAYNALQDTLPQAFDGKCFATAEGTTLRFDPTYQTYERRDTGDLGNAPVHVVVAPAQGSLTQTTGSRSWAYVPAAGSYVDQFSYMLVDRYDRSSNTATVTLRVGSGPCP